MQPTAAGKHITTALLYFLLSTAITWWFIVKASVLYDDENRMLLSCSIAGAKWALQIGAAFLLLKDKKWLFISRIGHTCFVGSCILLPFCILPILQTAPIFVASLVLAVARMIMMYYHAVRQTHISMAWFWAWIGCLGLAISSQLLFVFEVL